MLITTDEFTAATSPPLELKTVIIPIEGTGTELSLVGHQTILGMAIDEAKEAGANNIVLVCSPEDLEMIQGYRENASWDYDHYIQLIKGEQPGSGLARALYAARNCLIPGEQHFGVISPYDVMFGDNALQQLQQAAQPNFITLGAVNTGEDSISYAGRAILPQEQIMTRLNRAVQHGNDGKLTLEEVIRRDSKITSRIVLHGAYFPCHSLEQVAAAQTYKYLSNSDLGPDAAGIIVASAGSSELGPCVQRPLSKLIAVM